MGRLDLLRYFVKRGYNALDQNEAALQLAACHLPMVKYLMELGADANAGDALKAAAVFGGLETVKCLVAGGAAAKACRTEI